jgi:hypothetical protein
MYNLYLMAKGTAEVARGVVRSGKHLGMPRFNLIP